MQARTHKCGELRKEHVGLTVALAGWVDGYRDHGGIIFIDLRDHTGITQVKFSPQNKAAHDLADKFRNEDVVWMRGAVVLRGKDDKGKDLTNPKLPTGEIELDASEADLLSNADTPPFIPSEAGKVNEETRLKYRYIDLRTPRLQKIMRTRHRVAKLMRDYFDAHGFCEVETPFLCKSTPEGARDFLVPSRLQPGSFYALPQSPQLFKQILMVAGFERYVQIVRCFRDEDPRADRQAEFTQLDLEMSFVDQDDVLTVVEGLMRKIWKEILGIEIPNPIPRMTYAESMDRFGSDRPDLRFGMELVNIADLAAKTEFGVFKDALAKGGIVKAIRVPGGGAMTRKETDGLAEWVKQFGAKGLAITKVVANGTFETGIAKFIAPIAGELVQRMDAKEGDLLCFAADSAKVAHRTLGELRVKLSKDRGMLKDGDWKWLWVIDFPAFEWNADEKRYDSLHHPFTSPRDADFDKLTMEKAGDVIAKAYDIVCNGSELGGGSIRIHRSDIQNKVFNLLGIDDAAAKVKFGFLLDALRHGAPPHGGLALGLDRIIMHLCGTTNIRDVIAFPKTQNGADLMTEAPSTVDLKQLTELSLRVQTHAKPDKAV